MQRLNMLVIATDQERWDAVGANDIAEIHTPSLERFAQQGINADQCFVQNPVCTPSRPSFLTGQDPAPLRLTQNGILVLPDPIVLPRLLKPYGCHGANIGKLHFQPHANRDRRARHREKSEDTCVLCGQGKT